MEEGKEITNSDLLEALNELNKNSIATNNSIKELNEYLIIKDKQDQQEKETQKKQSEQAEIEESEIQEQQEQEQQSALAEQSAKADAQNQEYTTLLTDIRSELQLNNALISGQFMMFGIICGILLFKILWDKLN